MRSEEIKSLPGSFLIEVGANDVINVGTDEKGKFHSVKIRYEKIVGPGGAYMSGESNILFENEDLCVVGKYSTHKEFDGKLLGVILIRKTGETQGLS
jgi:hypothetical protein